MLGGVSPPVASPVDLDNCAMMTRLAISGYRSLRDVRVTLGALTVVTGANGSGKSSLYRDSETAGGHRTGSHHSVTGCRRRTAVDIVGRPGSIFAGNESRQAAGARRQVRKNAISLKLGFSGDDYGYAIDLGLPSSGIFLNDPAIKVESLWTGERLGRSNAFAISNRPLRAHTKR